MLHLVEPKWPKIVSKSQYAWFCKCTRMVSTFTRPESTISLSLGHLEGTCAWGMTWTICAPAKSSECCKTQIVLNCAHNGATNLGIIDGYWHVTLFCLCQFSKSKFSRLIEDCLHTKRCLSFDLVWLRSCIIQCQNSGCFLYTTQY